MLPPAEEPPLELLVEVEGAAAGAEVLAGDAAAAGAAGVAVVLASSPFFLRGFLVLVVLVSALEPAAGELVGCAAAGAVAVVPVPVSSPFFFLLDFLLFVALASGFAEGVAEASGEAVASPFFFFFLVVVLSSFWSVWAVDPVPAACAAKAGREEIIPVIRQNAVNHIQSFAIFNSYLL